MISVYRPPDSSSELFFAFENLIKSVDDENKEFHILGELNCDMLKDDSDPPTIILKGILESYQLFQLITEATRITNRSRTLIDHYITSTPEKFNFSGIIHTSISDHSPIYGIRKLNSIQNTRKKENRIEVRNMKRFNKEHFNADLLAQPWEKIVLKPDTNSMWTLWKDLFMEFWISMLQFSRSGKDHLVSRGLMGK